MIKCKAIAILIIFISSLLLSCNNDEASTSTQEPSNQALSIEGKWVFSKEGFVENGQEVLANYTHTATCEKDFIRFTGTVINSVYFEKPAATCNEINTPGTFVRTGDEIKITEDGVVKTLKILNLSATELKTSTVFPNGTFVEVYTKG